MSDTAVAQTYVYGVCRGGALSALSTPGVESAPAPPRVVESREVAAIVGSVEAPPILATRDNLEAHAAVLAEAVASTTVLPLRFGVVMPGEDVVRRELLEARHDELATLLARFGGHVELSVRAFYEGDVALREVVAEERAIADLSARVRELPEAASYFERIRLGELTAAGLARKRAADEESIVARLRPLAADVRLDGEPPERVVTNGAYLVRREHVEEFDRALEELAAARSGRIRFKYVGPLALHSFVEVPQAPRAVA